MNWIIMNQENLSEKIIGTHKVETARLGSVVLL